MTTLTPRSVELNLGASLVRLVNEECFEWLRHAEPRSIHAVVTDPPFGIQEYTETHLAKRASGRGGVWRIPPSFDGSQRQPLPRFTVLSDDDLRQLRSFFLEWGTLLQRVLAPGAHVFVASTTALHHTVFGALQDSGLEGRGEVVRIVRTFRGGDRPKGAEDVYPDVSSMLRSNWEPWGVFRMPFDGTLRDNLGRWGVGGLRRREDGTPLGDVVESGRTPRRERDIVNHPSLKPQAFLRTIVRASLPLGAGVVLDPFAGSGSTLAAAASVGYDAVGVEVNAEFYSQAIDAIPRLMQM